MRDINKIKCIDKLLETKTSNQAIKEAFIELFPQKKFSVFQKVLFVVLICLGIFISMSEHTISSIMDIAGILNTIVLAIFGTIFTGYALFQALLNRNMLKRMLEINEEQKTYVQKSNEYFLHVMMLNVICIVSNFLILLLGKTIPENVWGVLPSEIRMIIIVVSFAIYIFVEFLTILEVKSFVFNIYQLFNIFASNEAVEIIKEDDVEREKF